MGIDISVAVVIFCVLVLAFIIARGHSAIKSSNLTPMLGLGLMNEGEAPDKRIMRSAVFGVPMQTKRMSGQSSQQLDQHSGQQLDQQSIIVGGKQFSIAEKTSDTSSEFNIGQFKNLTKWEEDAPLHISTQQPVEESQGPLCNLDCQSVNAMEAAKHYFNTKGEMKGAFTMNPLQVNQLSPNQCDILYQYVASGGSQRRLESGQDKRRFTYAKISETPCIWDVTGMGDFMSGLSIQ